MKKIESIEVCRGVAATMVLLFHASGFIQSPAYFSEAPVLGVVDWGDAGVDFFFVLSGFLIVWVNGNRVGNPGSIGPYLWKRFARVYPIYWVITVPLIIAYFILPLSGEGYETQVGVILGSLSLFPVTEFPVLPVAWTLSYEVYFYLVFGLVLIKPRLGLGVILIWQAASLANVFLSFNFGPWVAFLFNPYNLHFGFGLCVGLFLRRMTLWQAYSFSWISSIALLALGLSSVYLGFERDSIWRMAFAFCSAVLVLSLASQETRRSFRIPPALLLLGSASYSIYLLHYPLQLLLVKGFKFGEQWVSVPISLMFAIIVSISLIAAIALHVAVERPLTNWVRAIGNDRLRTIAHPS